MCGWHLRLATLVPLRFEIGIYQPFDRFQQRVDRRIQMIKIHHRIEHQRSHLAMVGGRCRNGCLLRVAGRLVVLLLAFLAAISEATLQLSKRRPDPGTFTRPTMGLVSRPNRKTLEGIHRLLPQRKNNSRKPLGGAFEESFKKKCTEAREQYTMLMHRYINAVKDWLHT